MKIGLIFGLFLVSVNAAPPPVSNVQIDSVGIDFFVVKWDQYNNTVSGFQVEYSIIPQTEASIRDTEDNSKNFFNVTNLFSGTSYQVRVRPIGGFNETFISSNNETEYGQWSVYATCVTEGPLPPKSLSITNIIDTKVNLKWTASSSKVDSYQLFIRNSKSLQVTNQYVVSSDVYEIEVELLTPSTPYSVFVNALLNNVRSSYLTGGFQTRIAPPEAPKNLSVSNILETSAMLSWVDPQNGQDIVSYMIELLEISSNGNTSVFLSNSANYVVIGLKIATNYTFRVRSVSVMTDVISEWSSVVGFKTLTAALPPSPRFVSISNVSKESAMVTWETPTTLYPINSYNIVYKIIGMQPMSQKVPGDVNSYTLMNLVSGTQYRVAIQAVVLNDVFGEFSVDNIFVTAGPKPVSITISAISDSSANVSWNGSSIGYSSSIIILFDNSIKVINTTKLFTKNVSWYTFTNLAPNNPYIIKIFVKDENNISSSEASNGFRTKLGPDVLNAPTNTSVSILSPSSVLFQCNTVSLAVAYEIKIEGNPNPRVPLYRTDQFSAFLDSSLIQKMEIKDLISGYGYFLSVRGIFGDYAGQWSPVVPIVLYGGRPPSQIQITNINENSAIVRLTQAYDRLTLSRINIKYFIKLEDTDGKSNLINITFAIPQGNYGKSLSFKFPNLLVSNSSYKVSIFCEKDNINGTANVTTFKTLLVSIATPNDLVIFNNDTSVKIKWNVINMNDILYYVVELYTSESGSLYFRTDGPSPSLDIYSLFPNTYYQFRVHAVGAQNNVGEWSAWESVVTQSKMEVSEAHSNNHSNHSNSGVIVGVTIGVVGIVLIFAYVVRTLWKKKYKPTKFKQFENSVKYSKNSLKEQINVQRTST
ncbi:tenascin-R isoform X2 [Hydra vulgaris]|uniref:tenascin-R isoform X2 n=1 Tax=Hydra vulgaris TaxID=6087 RepID=UPI001F5FE7F0|nr:tenascin-R isoform X2 [Hydra vulgaris]